MKAGKMSRIGAVVATGAVATALAAGDGARAQDYDIGTGPVKIQMKLKGKGRKAVPFFSASAKKISRGAKLTIVNTTKIQQIGPHTFSLVKPAKIPNGTKAQRKCGGSETTPPSGICLKIFKAHKVDFQTGKVGKISLDVGKKGWDKSFGKKGDSWVTEGKGQTTTRKVTAKVGTTLTYFCAVHPNMVGKLKVVK